MAIYIFDLLYIYMIILGFMQYITLCIIRFMSIHFLPPDFSLICNTFSYRFSQIRFFHSMLGIIFSIFIASYNSFINLYFFINIGKRSIDCYPEITSHAVDNYI